MLMKERSVYSTTKSELDINPKKQELTQVASLLSFVSLGRHPSTTSTSQNLELGSLLQFPNWITSFTQRCPPGNSNDIDGKEAVAIGEFEQINFGQGDPEDHESRHKIDFDEENEKPSNDSPSCNDNSDEPKVIDLNQEELDNRLNECDKVLSDRELLRKNAIEQRCGTNQTYSCPDCEFTSQKNEDIKKHKLKHRKRKRCCSLCGFISKDKIDFQLHKLTHEKKKEKSVGLKKYACETCDYKASQKIQLNVHMTFVHNAENLVKHVFHCNECPRRLLSKHKLEEHMKMHSPPAIPCHQCGRMFHTDEYLRRHCLNVHTPDDEKQWRCNKCGKGFISSSKLTEHLNTHLEVKPHMCSQCGKHFSNVSNYQSHTRKLHPEHFKAGKTKSVRVR